MLGIEGPEVRVVANFPHDWFRALALRYSESLEPHFDMACSLGIAEYLSPESGLLLLDHLVVALVVVFSAGLAGQRGPGHINEPWQDCWWEFVADSGLLPSDVVQPAVRGDERVSWLCQRNLIVYVRADRAAEAPTAALSLNLVDPILLTRAMSGSEALRALLRALFRQLYDVLKLGS